MIDQRHTCTCSNAPSSPASSPPPSSLMKPAFVPAPPASRPSSSSSSASLSDIGGNSGTVSSSNTSMRKNRIRPRGEHRRPSYLLPMPAATCATLPPSMSKPYTCNNDTDEDEHDNCSSITSQQSQLYELEQDGTLPNRRRRRIFLFSAAAAAAAAVVVLLLVASVANTSAHGGGSAAIRQLFPSFHQQDPSSAASSVDALDARDVLLMAERDALTFKRDAAGLQRTNDRLKAELSMPSQAEPEVEKEAEGRQ